VGDRGDRLPTYMTGETWRQTMDDYVCDFDREFTRSGVVPHDDFFEKWGLLIKLVTGLHLLEIRGVHAFSAAHVAASRCRQLTSATLSSSQSVQLPDHPRSGR
jgi:hypothetical protein